MIMVAASLPAVGQTKPISEVTVSRCWAYPTLDTGVAVATDTSRIYVGAEGGKVEALSLDGKKMWSTEFGGELSSNLIASDRGLLLVTSTQPADDAKSTSVLRSLSKETGIPSWTLKLPDAERHFLGLNNGAVVIVSKSGTIQSVDSSDGSIKWRREIADGFAADPAFSLTRVIVAGNANQIFSISLATGEIEAMRKSVYRVTSLGEMPSGEVIAGDERGNVSTLNGSDKPVWKFKSGGEISRLFLNGTNILATSHDNFIYYLSNRNGDVEWKKRLGGRVLHLSNIADKYVLSMSFEENIASLTDLTTGKVAGQIVFGADEKLAADPVFANGSILLVTNAATYSYSLTNCAGQKDTAANRPSAAVALKNFSSQDQFLMRNGVLLQHRVNFVFYQ